MLCLYLTNLFFNPACVASEVGVCEGNEIQAYHSNVDARGMGLCGVSPAPLKTIEHTQHHGECLASCAEFPGCFSYNFYHDSTKCELFCVPEKYAIIPNCFNYLVRVSVCRVYYYNMIRLIAHELMMIFQKAIADLLLSQPIRFIVT